MKKIVALVSLLLIATAATAQYKPKTKPGAKAATPQAVPATGEFRRISREEAYKLWRAGTAIFVDVRSHQSFTNGHIRGAKSIPGSELITRFAEVQQPDKLIITYCACDAEQSSGKAVLNLNAHGVKNAAALKGGYIEWRSAGHPVLAGPK